MTSKNTEAERVAVLLDTLLASSEDDLLIAELVNLEGSSDERIQGACHQARHFIADRDLHAQDPAYARQQRSALASLICRMRQRGS